MPLILLILGLVVVVSFPGFVLAGLGLVAALVVLYFVYMWYRRRTQRQRLLLSGIREIDVMPGFQFERFLGALFERVGYSVEYTPQTGDFGADLILQGFGATIAVQAKRYDKTVGVNAVQEVHASKAYYRASEAWVITNQDFSEAARQLANKSQVRLINRAQLIDLIVQAQKATS